MPESKRVLGEGRDTAPLRPWGEREGPIAQRWEGEVGLGNRSGIPHLTPTLSAPGGGEGVELATRALAIPGTVES